MNELNAAWRALDGLHDRPGWRTISISFVGPCQLLAGRYFPGNKEALLFGFSSIQVPPTELLPRGRGFQITQVVSGPVQDQRAWIALCREDAGNLELFSMMADDVVNTLRSLPQHNDQQAFQVLVARLRAWQDFMEKGRDGLLKSDAEVGLVGELFMLRSLVDAGWPPSAAVEAWQGPLDGIHDFAIGSGAIEVKSTISSVGFSATVGSLEQLDDSAIKPLFVAAVRITINSTSGLTLPRLAQELRDHFSVDPYTVAIFNDRLLHAGLPEGMEERYSRHFNHVQTRIVPVTPTFPKLTRANVAPEIMRVKYEINLGDINLTTVPLIEALNQLG